MNKITSTAIGKHQNPDYYIISRQISEVEEQSGLLYDQSNPADRYLMSIASSLGIDQSNSKFVKMIHEVGESYDQDYYLEMLKEDIRLSNPKVILVLGGGVGKLLYPQYSGVARSRGKLADYVDGDFTSKILMTYSPNYVVTVISELENSSKIEAADEFYTDMNYIRKYVAGELVDLDTKEITYALTYEEFKEYHDKYLIQSDLPAFDIESNAKRPTTTQFRVIGFSIAPDPTKGIYVVRDALEYQMPEEDWEKVVQLTVDYLKQKTVVVHNCGYEIPAILNEWGYRIENFEDTLAKAKILQGGKIGAGLVDQCTKELGYPVWDADLGTYIRSIRALKDNLFPTPSGNHRWDYKLLVDDYDKSLDKLYQHYLDIVEKNDTLEKELRKLGEVPYETQVFIKLVEYYNSLEDKSQYSFSGAMEYLKKSGVNLEYGNYNKFSNLFAEITTRLSQDYLSVASEYNEISATEVAREEKRKELKSEIVSFTKREDKVFDAVRDLLGIIDKYYVGEERQEIISTVAKEVIRMVEIKHTGLPSYSTIPLKIITNYGAMDAIGTRELYDHLSNRLTMESSDDVDLWSGYKVAKANMLAGVAMEMNGLHWDDNVAQEEYNWYESECHTAACNMISSGYLDDYIFENCQYMLHEDVMENRMHHVKEILGDFQMMKTSIRIVDSEGNRIRTIYHKRILEEIEKARPGYIESNREWLLNKVKSSIHDRSIYPDYHALKDIFNPNSTKVVPTLSDIFITEDMKVGHIITQLNLILDDDNFDIDKYPGDDRKLFELIHRFRDHDKEVELYNDSAEAKENGPKQKIPGKVKFEKFKVLLSTLQLKSKDIVNIIADASVLKLDSASEPVMIELFHNFENTGIDIEDESTWTPEFRFFYNFRVWKKCNKMITSYITGNKVGRGSVYVAKKDDALSHKELVVRRRLYDERKPKEEDEVYLMTSPPGVMAADTMRWTWALHTIPAGSSIKNIYTSRYKGGMTASPDYSQLEVRMIAGAAKCKPMLDAFANGADIHLETASRVWRKNPEDITDAERRYSKMTTFAILYGATAKNIANNFMGGDVAAATDMYDSFFEGYPELRTWVDARHKEMLETGRVSCSNLGYYLFINPEDFYDGEEGAKRASQNYPIQSFRGCTAITGVDGSTKTFKELVDNNESDYWVWTYDHDTNRVVPMKGIAPQITGESDIFYKITLDNGKYFEVTPEHLCMIRDGSYVRADELEVGQSLMPLHVTGGKYKQIATEGISNHRHYMHREVYDEYGIEPLDATLSYAIHHIDLNPHNNHPANLCKLPQDYHFKYHALIRRDHDEDLLAELESELYTILRKVYKLSDADELLNRFKVFHRSDKFNLEYIRESESMTQKNRVRSNRYREWDKNQREAVSKEVLRRYEETGSVLGINDPLKRSELHRKVWRDHGDKIRESLKVGHNTKEAIENHTKAAVKRESDLDYVVNRVWRQVAICHDKGLEYRTPEDWDKSKSKIMMSPYALRKSSYVLSKMEWSEFLERVDERLEDYESGVLPREYEDDPVECIFNVVKKQLIKYHEANLEWRTPEDWDGSRFKVDMSKYSSKSSDFITDSVEWLDFKKYAEDYLSRYNHKIVEIEVIELDEPEPKYDLEVPKYHNFALDAGVFVHNSQGSMTGGFVANEIDEYIRSNNLLSKLVLFTHDSIGVDIHPKELFRVGTTIIPLMNELPYREFGIPTKADITIGASMGQEMDVVDIQADDDYNSGIIRFNGFEDDYLAAKRLWEENYRVVEDRDFDEPSEIYIPRGDLFVPKKAIHKTFGSSRRLVNKEVKIIID